MADKRCDNGHFIDEIWDLCPYCPQDTGEPEHLATRQRSIDTGARIPVSAVVRENTLRPITAARGAAVQPPPMERTIAAGFDPIAPKRYVVGWLVALSGSARGESFPVRMGRNVIGRDRTSDVVIGDDQASSHHADLVFRPEERRFILMDHNSTNGTYVNETEIEPRRDLAGKDVIRIGSHRFLFMPLCHEGFHWDDEGLLK